MKKLFILSVLLSFFINTTYSQSSDYKKFRFGLKGSSSLSWLKSGTKEYKSDGSKITFGYGLMTEFGFSKNYSFLTGFDVSVSGGKLLATDTLMPLIADRKGDLQFSTPTSIAATTSIDIKKLQYIEIPLLLKMKTNEIGYITYFGLFGVNAAINLKSIADFKVENKNGESISEKSDINIKSNIIPVKSGLVIGGGLEYSLGGNTAAIMQIVFNNGFTDIFKEKQDKSINNNVTLTLGIIF
ncbi:MAG: hypothetical protein A2X12_12170 [Bacteroidetes bacterium GWE2_29_8]|nr:MAG: hypothetical protein A2X12_12170 [Bacteroidetes bacterium GWE2_29_8]OFY24588.1 MAG: hypothetical protein A2X02_03225 [Bacteroidetes bacterium GWF2_29_10]